MLAIGFLVALMLAIPVHMGEAATDSGLRNSAGVTFGLSNQFTLSAWYRIDAVGGNGEKTPYDRNHGIGSYNPDNTSTFYFDCRFIDTSDNPQFGQVQADHAQAPGEWWHLVQTVAADGTMNIWYQPAGDTGHDGVDATTSMADYKSLDTSWMATHAMTLGLYEGKSGSGGSIRTGRLPHHDKGAISFAFCPECSILLRW